MLLVFATDSFFASLTATPPHLSTPLTLMQLAAPVEVFFFLILEVAILARLCARVKLTLPLDKLLNASFILVALRKQVLSLSLKLLNRLSLYIVLVVLLLKLDLEPSDLLLVCHIVN